MVDVGGRPILWHLMKGFAHWGYTDFVLCLGYRGNTIKDYFLSYEAMNNDFTIELGKKQSIDYHDRHGEQGFKVTLAETGAATMTGGRVKRIQRYIDDGDEFIVTYGDGLADVNVRELVDFHRSKGKIATVTTVAPISRYGAVDISDSDLVTKFVEKPRQEARVNAGFFVFNKKFFEYLDGDECMMEQGPLDQLASEGQLVAFRHDGFFYAMDTYREYLHLNHLWNSGNIPWKVWP